MAFRAQLVWLLVAILLFAPIGPAELLPFEILFEPAGVLSELTLRSVPSAADRLEITTSPLRGPPVSLEV